MQTNRYKTETSVNSTTDLVSYDNTTVAPLATMTLYNSLGQAYMTEQYSNVLIEITADSNAPSTSGIEMATAPTGLTPQSANFISSTQTWYDDQGRSIETKNAAGLRTGTIYYSNGQVEYTGPLNASAPDGGEVNSTTDVISFQLSDFASYTQYLYDQFAQTTTSENFTMPASGSTVTITVGSTTGFSAGQYVSVAGVNGFIVSSVVGGTTLVLSSLGIASTGAANSNGTIYIGSTVSTGVYNETIDPDDHWTDTVQDPQGRTIATVYEDGSLTQTLYSVGDQAISGYDVSFVNSGTITTALPAIPEGGSETIQIAQRKGTDPIVYTIDIYDASGNLVAEWEPPVADPAQSNDSINPEWVYTYNASGEETSQTSANNDTTNFFYDENGNTVRETRPDGNPETWTYDQFGRELTYTDFDGNVATYSYYTSYGDGAYLGSLYQVVYTGTSGTETVTYTYTPLGQQDQVTDASGNTTYNYNSQGDMTLAATPEGTINYVYDAATGNHVETDTLKSDILYGYDTQGRLTTVTVKELNGTSLSTPLVTQYTYDNVGNLLTETDPDGVTTTYTYDDLNRLQTETQKNATNTTLYTETLTLNHNGTIAGSSETQMFSSNGASDVITSNYGYDADGHLTSVSVSHRKATANPAGQADDHVTAPAATRSCRSGRQCPF